MSVQTSLLSKHIKVLPGRPLGTRFTESNIVVVICILQKGQSKTDAFNLVPPRETPTGGGAVGVNQNQGVEHFELLC